MMKSQKSLFNKSIFIDNVSRLWPVSAVIFIIGFFAQTLRFYSDVNYLHLNSESLYEVYSRIFSIQIISLLFGFICSYLVFQYLFSNRLCNQIHAFPLSRKTLYFTNYISGYALLAVPQIVNCLLSIPPLLIVEVKHAVLLCFIATIAFSLLSFSVGVFAAMISGNMFAMAIICVMLNFINRVFSFVFGSVYSHFCQGAEFSFSGGSGSGLLFTALKNFLPIDFISYSNNTEADTYYDTVCIILAMYLVAAIALSALSYRIYIRRQAESAGSMITFNGIKGVIKWMITLSVSALISLIFSFAFEYYFIIFITFSFIIYFAVQMLFEKTSKINFKKYFVRWIAVIAAIFVCCGTAGTVVNHYMPKESKIKKIYISNVWSNEITNEIDLLIHPTEIKITDPDRISSITELHRDIMDEKPFFNNDINDLIISPDDEIFRIKYVLDNGIIYYKDFSATDLLDQELKDRISDCFQQASNSDKLFQYLMLNDIEHTKFDDNIFVYNGSDIKRFFLLNDPDDVKKILNAYAEDMNEVDTFDDDFYIIIDAFDNFDTDSFQCNENNYYFNRFYDTSAFNSITSISYDRYLYFSPDFKHTIAVLKEVTNGQCDI